ncbi:helix-turn-helix domain-containing protein [Pedobacter chinensis]|uniref:Helix-turn-helix domain-containing protein n=1 Tax=Pedobacter chinensis TaxID=2282421 RepID=A0A369PSK5_9SPHI|nr:helix-turn-helix domain-containing protein [Pedobacter chinensis]RDC55240.1 helix-turn-helix domain-containing protein [Pedobacter chinensis]
MESSLPLLLTALSAGSLFLAAFLLSTGLLTQNKLANRWLGAFFLLLSLVFAQFLLELADMPNSVLIRLTEWPRWLIFPFVHFAVYAFVRSDKMTKFWYLHLLPAILFILLFILNDAGFLPSFSTPAILKWLVKYFFFFQGLFYATLNLKILKSHKARVRQLLADHDSDLNWLRQIVLAPFYIALIWLLVRYWELGQITSQLIYLGFCLYFITAALQQRAVYPIGVDTPSNDEEIQKQNRNDKQRLTHEQVELLKDKVTISMEKDKLHLDPSLNLKMMADKVGINTHELSLVLNQGFGKNFYNYINGLRAEEALKLLKSSEYTRGDMREVAIRSGFNSRTTFYSAIKKIKGVSPLSILNENTDKV